MKSTPPSADAAPPTKAAADDRHNARLGLRLFAVYCAAYSLFMVLAAFSPSAMDYRIAGRVNLAVTYGFGLIVLAFVLAAAYLLLATGGRVTAQKGG